jgi:serine/threonine protein kinase/Flp pilus assembly protein TadD
MDTGHNGVSSREGRLDELATAYLKDVEAGRQPDRQALLAGHPELAAELAQFFEDQDALDGLAVPRREPAPILPPKDQSGADSLLTEQLGDFRIVREVGRGGMGVVYEAEQVSLRRRVALKVLPLAATLGGTQLQRFHNEARAAAGLHHTNIVPVYFVGCERGVHFYAMQFIDGQSLAAVLARLREPADPAAPPQAADTPTTAHVPPPGGGEANGTASTQPAALLSTAGGARGRAYFRAVAELGVQAAEALDHGHRVGVVHRDVKPGNLLLDGAGQVWVTDFGLAQMQGAESLTATGELVGTLRYMSPEQALAKRVVLDHRTDVYSLGATLYELLTLRPPFGGADRQELLRQISFEEPVPPRRLDRHVPAELETVALKALEKAPQDRYATAQELADDLRRWLDDRPIQARRPSWLRVAARWARRHRPLVGAVAAVLLMAALLGGGTWLWWAQKRAMAEGGARAALREAFQLLEQERWPEALSAARRAEGVLAGVGADPGLWRQVDELIRDLDMADRLQEASLRAAAVKDGHFDHAAANEAYATAFGAYGLDVDGLDPRLAVEWIRGRPIHRQLVAALDDWAFLRQKLKVGGWRQRLAVTRAADPDQWRNRLRDGLEGKDPRALEEIVTADPDNWPLATLRLLGVLAFGTTSNGRVTGLLERAQQRHPGDFWINHMLGQLLNETRPRRLEEVIRLWTVAVAVRPQSAAAHLNLGHAFKDNGRLDQAEAECREAIRLQKDYLDARINLALVLQEKGRLDEAIAESREAIRIKEDDPEPHNDFGSILYEKGQLDEAIAEFREALRLKKDYPEAHNNLGVVLSDKGRPEEAIAEYREALRLNKDYPDAHINLGAALTDKGLLDNAIAELREAVRLKPDHAGAHTNLGYALKAKGRLDEAVAECREAIRLKKDYPLAHCNLGVALSLQGQFPQAVAELRIGHELGSRDPRWPYPSAQWLCDAERLANLGSRLPALLKGQEQPKDVGERLALAQLCQEHKKLFAAAARWYGEAFAVQSALADDLSTGNRYNAACAAALAGCCQGQDAKRLSDKEQAGLRKQARDWLRADLEAWRRQLEKGPDTNRPAIAQQLAHWLEDTDFNGVRGEQALAKLPEAERGDWQKLWQEVEALRQRAARPPDKAAATRP